MHFIVKRKYKEEIRNIVNCNYYWLSFLDKEHLKILINLNYKINEVCIKVPHRYKRGDYVTCLDDISYELDSVHPADTINKITSMWGKNKTFQVDHIGGGGLTLFHDENKECYTGVFINWVRPATEYEIKNCKNEHKNKN